MLESVYEECLCFELAKARIEYQRQMPIGIIYEGVSLEAGFRADIVVNQELILEIKSVENLLPVHEAQVLTYLRMSGYRVGLLLNFNTLRLKDGIRRFVM